jgi:hypothetical protein
MLSAPDGQRSTQMPQLMHFVAFPVTVLILIISQGQAGMQSPQAVHLAALIILMPL